MCKYCDFFRSINFDIELLRDYEKIYCLVSGGIDSTLLAEYIYNHYPNKTYFVNCYNPYEINDTLKSFQCQSNYIEIKPDSQYNYSDILKDSFKKLNEAAIDRKEGKYTKKRFGCCYYIKHKAFLNDPLFKEEGSVVISGIKFGDGTQRHFWCLQLQKENTFFHRHLSGQMYCYPFRDYTKKEFPKKIMKELYKKYPNLSHSGCAVCPVIVLFQLKNEKKRYWDSVKFTKKLIKPSKLLLQYNPDLQQDLNNFYNSSYSSSSSDSSS